MSVEAFVDKTHKLLEKERSSEIEQTRLLHEKLPPKELQRRGVCLLKLHIGERKSGMFGRVLVVLETHLDALPSHTFSAGDIVGLDASSSVGQSDSLGSGIVTRVSPTAVTVAFDDSVDIFSLESGLHDYYKITKLANDVTYKRLKRTLEGLSHGRHEVSQQLISVLFGDQPLSPPLTLKELVYSNTSLDDSQQEAVQFALSQREVAVVHGPPGTGKTTTVIEIILQAVKQGHKVLACAPSNIAVDNLVDRLSRTKHRIVRLGHPARLLPHLQKFSLDAILARSDEAQLVVDVRKDLDKALSDLKKTRDRGQRQRAREDMKHLRKELRQRETTATRDILKRADVILVTLTSATDAGPMKLLEESHFDLTVIDEVSQALEAACWIPLLRSRKCVLAGDHLQLPPTILSNEMLTTQYRMHHMIMDWSSQQLYQSKLVAHPSVSEHLLRDMDGVEENETTSSPLLFIDTAGCDLPELDLPEEISKGNEGEADIVKLHVEKLIESGLKQEDIAVIAPYNLQVELVRLRLGEKYPGVEVKSVDGFQGREKEAVVISLVRSNPKGEVGFLSEKRRINVAVTRARRHLAVVGDSMTVSSDPFLKTLVEYMTTVGETHSATQPEHISDLISLNKQASNKGAKPKTSKKIHDKPRQNKKPSERKEENQRKGSVLEEGDERVKELQSQLEVFVANTGVHVLEFAPTLTSRDRLIVHEIAEKMGLSHVSRGIGEERHIVVGRPDGAAMETESPYQRAVQAESVEEGGSVDKDTRVEVTDVLEKEVVQTKNKKRKNKIKNTDCVEKNMLIDLDKENQTKVPSNDVIEICSNSSKSSEIARSDGKVSCSICQKDVIKANLMMHELHCAKRQIGAKSENVSGAERHSKNALKSSSHRQFDKELSNRIQKVDDDDIDALIATVQKMDSSCCFKKCKTSVATLFQVCSHCEGRYCLSHHIPEVHGCGDAARAQARARISKDGVLHRGSGVPDRSMDKNKKAHLQRKLDSKLTELSSKRKGKPKK
ncbi:SMBP2-like protein [Mya arenaria]|uniref:DNA helicase n=1 Tax=Mya arenaria TaxID=6604 RepID=A0ABY7DU58_MYAAR|nr:SMBP2-like protein [Mya arenaria]